MKRRIAPWERALDSAIKRGEFAREVDPSWDLQAAHEGTIQAIHVLSESKREGAFQFLGAVSIELERRAKEES